MVLDLSNVVDKNSVLGKDIKDTLKDVVHDDLLKECYNKYCCGNKAIKDNIYYFIHYQKNRYSYFSISRDETKSPRKIKPRPVKEYKATYDDIKDDSELISNYYSKKYSVSNKDNIIATMTDDDVLCLNCGCISDQRLSDVPDIKYHLNNMKCPKCNSEVSSLLTFNKYLHNISIHYRKSESKDPE